MQVAWGESTTQPNPGWRGAGTNGGTNLVIMHQSFGAAPNAYWNQLSSLFAGLHIFGTVMPVQGDTADQADTGTWFSYLFQHNVFDSVGYDWAHTVAYMPATDGTPCGYQATNYNNGGGRGINGCGCYLSVSVDVNQSSAEWHNFSENWAQLQSDATDASGANWLALTLWCNYDTTIYPLSL